MSTAAFGFEFTNAASYQYTGWAEFFVHGGNRWRSNGLISIPQANDSMFYNGEKELSATLTQIKLYGSNSHSFDGGSAALMYLRG